MSIVWQVFNLNIGEYKIKENQKYDQFFFIRALHVHHNLSYFSQHSLASVSGYH